MPEMRFHIRWPDGSREACYSPSLVIKDHSAVGQDYVLDEFLAPIRLALGSASDKVRERYGFPEGGQSRNLPGSRKPCVVRCRARCMSRRSRNDEFEIGPWRRRGDLIEARCVKLRQPVSNRHSADRGSGGVLR